MSILINVFWQSNKNSYQTLRFQTVIILINIILILFAFGFIYYYFPILSNVRLPYRWSMGITFCLILLYAISLNSIISALSNNSSAFSKYSNLTNKINSIVIINLKIIILLISLYSVVLISHNNIERTKRNSYENNVAINAEKTPHFYKLKELMRESNKNGNGLRFYATRDLIPPNIGNKYGFMYSAHGFRSSRTVKYHKFFDFHPLGEKVRSLSIKYWVEKGSNKLLQELDPIFVFDDIRIYELPNVYPILRYSDYNKSHINNDLKKDLKKIHFGTNAVYFNFNQELRGDFIFYSTWYPGFYVKTEYEKVRVTDKDGFMNFVLTHPTNKLTIKYQPNFFSYMAYFYCVLVLSIILYFYIIKSQR